MSKMKHILETLEEMIDCYPVITADYDVEFSPKTIKLIEVEDSEFVQDINDLGFQYVIVAHGDRIANDFTVFETVSQETGEVLISSVIIDQGSQYPMNLFTGTITIPLHYNGKYYMLLLNVAKQLDDDRYIFPPADAKKRLKPRQ